MSAIAVVHYCRFKTRAGAYVGTPYQDFSINAARVYNGVTYSYAPFAFLDAAGVKGGDVSSSSIVAEMNQISVNLFAEAVQSEWLAEIRTVALDYVSYADLALIRDQLWRAASYTMEYSSQRIVLRLSSPLDAVKSQFPSRYLSQALVGALPSSASIAVS